MKVSTVFVAFVAAVVASPVANPDANAEIDERNPEAMPKYTMPSYPTGYMEKRDIDARAYPTAPPLPTGYYGHYERGVHNARGHPPKPTGYAPFPPGYYMDKRNRRAFLPANYKPPSYPIPTYFPKPEKRNPRHRARKA